MPVGEGRFTPEKLAAALADVCALLDLDHCGAQLLRFTNNAVFKLAHAPVVVRIVGSRTLRHRVDKVVKIAQWFAAHDIPAVRLLPGVQQPIQVGEDTATVWQAAPGIGRRPRSRDLARLLRRVHALPVPPFELPGWHPLDDIRHRVDDAEALDPCDRAFLLDRCAELEERIAKLDYALPTSLIHGDAHRGNLIRTPSGPVLCDFDAACVGPPEWDLTPHAVGVTRFGESAASYRELANTYGMDVTRWAGFPVMREIRELKLITCVLPIMISSPQVRPELRRRLADYRAGNTTARWSRYR